MLINNEYAKPTVDERKNCFSRVHFSSIVHAEVFLNITFRLAQDSSVFTILS